MSIEQQIADAVRSAIRDNAAEIAREVVAELRKEIPTEPTEKRPYLTIQEVADLYGLNYKTVHGWIVRGELIAERPGRGKKWKVKRSDLESLGQSRLAPVPNEEKMTERILGSLRAKEDKRDWGK